MKKRFLLLGFITILALLLRFYQLGQVPVGFHRDEAFLGYNAYSILKTGKDINGIFLPIHLKSFLFSPGGYSYLSIPFIKIFDLNAFSVRFASALFGSATVFSVYFLLRKLMGNHKHSVSMSLFSALFLAISPWHINLSRSATESTIVLFLLILGLIFYLRYLEKKTFNNILVSFICFASTMLFYQAPRAFLPLFIPLLIFIYCRNLSRKQIILQIVLFIILIIAPLLFILSSKELSLRLRTVSIFSGTETQLVLNQQIREDGIDKSASATRVFHNKISEYFKDISDNYFNHFSYNFLFTDRAVPDRYRVPLSGLLYQFEIPFLVLGLVSIFLINRKMFMILVGWVLISPIGSALTFDDVPNLQRTLIMAPVFSIFTAAGIIYLFALLKKKKFLSRIIFSGVFIIFFYSFVFYLHQYYIHGKYYRPWYRNDGYKELVQKVNQVLPNYKKAIVTDRESAPTIFFLFYSKFDPAAFQAETKNKQNLDFDRISFSKYEFTQEECPFLLDPTSKTKTPVGKGILYVNSGLCKETPKVIATETAITRKDKSTVFRIISPR